MISELKEYLENTPKSKLLEEWKEIEALGFNGPNASEYLEIAFENCWTDYISPPEIKELFTNYTTPSHSASFFLLNL